MFEIQLFKPYMIIKIKIASANSRNRIILMPIMLFDLVKGTRLWLAYTNLEF